MEDSSNFHYSCLGEMLVLLDVMSILWHNQISLVRILRGVLVHSTNFCAGIQLYSKEAYGVLEVKQDILGVWD